MGFGKGDFLVHQTGQAENQDQEQSQKAQQEPISGEEGDFSKEKRHKCNSYIGTRHLHAHDGLGVFLPKVSWSLV